MTPEQKADISRTNGAKSRGPVTAAGRARSSRNATRHGFTSNNMVLLNCESPTEFQRVLDEYLLMYRPSSAIERSLVNEMVAAHWRIRRLWTIETALFNLELFRRASDGDRTPTDRAESMLATAFLRLADNSRALALCQRYEGRLHRMHGRARQVLRELRKSAVEKIDETNPILTPEKQA
jgi:hypothetical protein